MQIEQLAISGALAITLPIYSDSRGAFRETYARSRYVSNGISDDFTQDNCSISAARVLRGLHGDRRMAKLVQVLEGSALDVIVDIRPSSPSYLKALAIRLARDEFKQLYIPAGCLHGFLALEDDTILMYKQTAEYDPSQEIGVAWNDPDLAIDWPLEGREPLVSPKDAKNPSLRELGYL